VRSLAKTKFDEDIEIEPEVVIEPTVEAGFKCATELLTCPDCKTEFQKSHSDTCSTCDKPVKLKLVHFLHDPVSGKWERSGSCTK